VDGLASTIWDYTSTLLGTARLPAWYRGGHWAAGLGGLFALPVAALVCSGCRRRTRRLPPWTSVVLLIAAAILFGQFAVPRRPAFPPILAFIALSITALMHHTHRRHRPPALNHPNWPPELT
jgi:hypothetical protein